tara:strand:+ start:316 stop:495 length:180 start_codon:yes stop_codon:yes gene_type:complete
MLGQQMLLNGMTEMEMAEETILEEPLQMFAQMFQELHLDQPLAETVGVVMTPMETVGRT